jgi:hypothetical protein
MINAASAGSRLAAGEIGQSAANKVCSIAAQSGTLPDSPQIRRAIGVET